MTEWPVSSLDLRLSFAPGLSKRSDEVWDWSQQPEGSTDQIDLIAARNEVIGCQVWVVSRQDFVLVTDHTNWLHPLGFCPRLRLEVHFPDLPADAIEVFPVGYLEGDDHRFWMETLEHNGTIEARAYRPQAVYLRLRIPKSVRPGHYHAEVRAYTQFGFEDEQLCWSGKINLQIFEATLPDAADWSFHLNIWQHCSAIARQHRVALWSEAHFNLIDHYYASLAQLGQKSTTVIVGEIPWSGQRCFRDRNYPAYLFEHAIVAVSRETDGTLDCDFTNLDRLLNLAADHKIDHEIELFGLLNIWMDEEYGFGKVAPDAPDAIRIRCYDRKQDAFTYLRTADELRAYIRLLHTHFEERGVLGRIRIAADEPADLELFQERLAFLRDSAPGFKYSVAINHFEFMQDAHPDLLDAVPILPLACKDPELTAALAQRLRKKGGKLLFYVCCWPPIPNTFLHSPLVEAELLGWLTYALDLDGFLRWAFCLWPADPWQRISWRAPQWPAGDMYFVMPGLDGVPVETLRYEALRAAIQDFELLRLVKRSLSPSKSVPLLQQALDKILRAPVDRFAELHQAKAEDLYSLDPTDYADARKLLLEGLED